MGGEGSMSHMIITMRINRALRRSKRRKFRKQKSLQSSHNQKWKYIEISEEELQKIKKEIKHKVQQQQLLYNSVAVILLIITVWVLYHFKQYL